MVKHIRQNRLVLFVNLVYNIFHVLESNIS